LVVLILIVSFGWNTLLIFVNKDLPRSGKTSAFKILIRHTCLLELYLRYLVIYLAHIYIAMFAVLLRSISSLVLLDEPAVKYSTQCGRSSSASGKGNSAEKERGLQLH